jgi:pyruvate kinase
MSPAFGPRPALVATIGPASQGAARRLVEAGATALRLNASHAKPEEVRDSVRQIRAELPLTPIVVDLQGAKMRLGRFAPRPVRPGEIVCFRPSLVDATDIPLPHPEVFVQVQPGETLSVDDGRIRLAVLHVDADRLEARPLADGVLRARKGVNVAEHPVVLDDLIPEDRSVCELLAGAAGVEWALSFVADGRELRWLRGRVGTAPVVAKIERAEAVAHLPEIAAAADALWICRGDLGAQLGPAALARFVSSFEPRTWARPVLLAGQVLEHLTRHREPTRSEVCHLYDILARGYAGIVLSDETAIGADPEYAVRVAARLLGDLAPPGDS